MKMHNQQKNKFRQRNLAEGVFFTSVHTLIVYQEVHRKKNGDIQLKIKVTRGQENHNKRSGILRLAPLFFAGLLKLENVYVFSNKVADRCRRESY